MLSPFEYWQFWRNTNDLDVIRFLKLFTELPLVDINEMAKLEGAALNDVKKVCSPPLCSYNALLEPLAGAASRLLSRGSLLCCSVEALCSIKTLCSIAV